MEEWSPLIGCPLKGRKFFCREWAFSKLSQYLDSRQEECASDISSQNDAAGTSNVSKSSVTGVLLVGGAGCGKTALCCELIWPSAVISRQSELNSRLAAYHLCQSIDAASLEPSSFVIALSQQLLHCPSLPGYRLLVNSDPHLQSILSPQSIRCDPREALIRGVLEPLNCITAPPEPMMILVDSLHEIFGAKFDIESKNKSKKDETKDNDWRNITLMDLVAVAACGLPRFLLLVCTSRRGCVAVTHRLAGFRKLTLDDLRKSCVVRDIQQYILARLDADDGLSQQLDSETADMLNQLHIKSNGCMLYLQLVLDGVKQGLIRLREIQHIPGTLNGLYLWLCQRLFNAHTYSHVKQILNVLLAARTPVTLCQAFHISRASETLGADLSRTQFLNVLSSMDQLLYQSDFQDSNDPQLIIFHPSFCEWLQDIKYCTRRYLCQSVNGHAALAVWFASRGCHLTVHETITYAYHLTECKSIAPFNQGNLAQFMIDSGASVKELVLHCPVVNNATTQLLIDAGADLVCLDKGHDSGWSRMGVGAESPFSTSSSGTRSDNEGLIEDTVDAEGRTMLHQLAAQNRINAVRKLLKRGAYCDPEDINNDTPLCHAARHGNVGVVEVLLQAGANPNHIGSDGWTPLRSASWAGHSEVVEILLGANAFVDGCGTDTRTALRAASWGGHEDVVRRLLAAGAKPNKSDNDGRTPLMAAAYMGHVEIVKLLLKKCGESVNHCDNDGRSALSVTVVCASNQQDQVDHVSVARALLHAGAAVDAKDKSGRTPLFSAALEGHYRMCELLIEYGCDVDAQDNTQTTALLTAAACGHADVVRVLLDANAHADTIDSEGRTVLSIASIQGCPRVVDALLRRGLDEMHRDHQGWMPIHHAAAEGNKDACRLLCQRSPSLVNTSDHDGRHPLCLAAEEGHSETCMTLIQLGAPINQTTLEGLTPLRLAATAGHQDTCKLLVGNGADTETKDLDGRGILYALVMLKNANMVECLLKLGSSVNTCDSSGRSCLYVAVWQGDSPLVELLLKYVADTNLSDQDGRTPLMVSLWRNHVNLVPLLIKKRADMHKVCHQGATALSVAAQQGSIEGINILLKHGANPLHKDEYNRTPADVALRAGHKQAAALLNDFQRPVDYTNTTQYEIYASPSAVKRQLASPPPSHCGGSFNSNQSFSSPVDKASSGYASLTAGSAGSNRPDSKNRSPRFGMNSGFSRASTALAQAQLLASGSTVHSEHESPWQRNDGRMAADCSTSAKSTLSSECGGTPENDFARQLLQRSLPRAHSRPLSVRLTAAIPIETMEFGLEPPECSSRPEFSNESSPDSQTEFFGINTSTQSFSRIGSVPVGTRKRPGIATNPKCRGISSVGRANGEAIARELSQAQETLKHIDLAVSSVNEKLEITTGHGSGRRRKNNKENNSSSTLQSRLQNFMRRHVSSDRAKS